MSRGKNNKSNNPSALVTIYVSSLGTDAQTQVDPDGKKRKYLQGSVNGVPFRVVCNEQTQVSTQVAEALRGLIEQQQREMQ